MPSKQRACHIADELQRIADAMERLRSLGVIRSQKVVSDIGEWLAATLLGGNLADSKNQKGWDITCGKAHIQVRTHAKAGTNKNRFTRVADVCAGQDDLAVVVLSPRFLVDRIFVVPNHEVRERANKKGALSWKSIASFEIKSDSVPSKALRWLFEKSG
jgi:hypothetical protein